MSEYKIKALLQEADLSSQDPKGESANVISMLISNPSALQRHEPPAGYEDRLMAALKTRIALERPRANDPRRARTGVSVFARMIGVLRQPQISWSVSAGLAILIAVLALNNHTVSPEKAERKDMLASAAVKGGDTVVDEWMESVGDSGIRMAHSERDLASIAHNIDEMGDSDTVDRALDEVAASLGYSAKN